MESKSSPVSFLSLPSKFTGHVQTVGVSARTAAETWNSGAFYKSLVGSKAVLSTAQHPEKSSAISDSQPSFIGGISSEPMCPGASFSSLFPFDNGNINLPISGSNPGPILKLTPSMTAELFLSDKIGTKLESSARDNLQVTSSQFDKLEVQCSEACQKRFIMFDHSGSKRRIIFHPTLVNEFSTLLPHTSRNLGDCLGHLQDVSVKAVDQLKETMVSLSPQADIAAWESRSYRETMSSAFAQGMKAKGPRSFDFMGDGLATFSNTAEEAESTSRVSGNGVSLDYSGGSHEDTKDLEALLSSDDEENSTGHSPSDVTWNNAPTLSDNDSKDYSCATSSKKRRKEMMECGNDDEADSSSATLDNESVEVTTNDMKLSCADVSHEGAGSLGSGLLKQGKGSMDPSFSEKDPLAAFQAAFGVSYLAQTSSRSSATKYRRYHGQSSGQQGPAKRSRKEKIKKTVRLLRSIIPGGDCMDTAIVLDEAIQYVKSLQVKVQKLEAKKFM